MIASSQGDYILSGGVTWNAFRTPYDASRPEVLAFYLKALFNLVPFRTFVSFHLESLLTLFMVYHNSISMFAKGSCG